MIKLLIADDEHIVTESIKFIVDKFITGVQVVGTAASGREAIEKSIELKPDVIFMDIRMPGINGIDAIRQVKNTNNDIVFVIITAYEYFDYAKDAVNLGVYEYLLKPLNKNKVIEILNKICEMISLNREAIQREILLKERINKIIPHMEGQFIYSQLFNGRVIKDIEFYEEIFGMKIKHGYVIMGIVDEFQSSIKEENLKNSLKKQKFYDIFSLELKKLTPCLIGPPLLDRTVAYIPIDQNIDSYKIRNKSIDVATKIIDRISKSVKIHYKIGVGRSYDIENFSKSCNEAYMAASFENNDMVVHFEDIVPSLNKIDTYPTNKEKVLIHKMLTKDYKGVLNAFEDIFWWLSQHHKNDINKIKSRLIELFIVLKRAIPYDVLENDSPSQSYLTNILKINNISELKISYIDYLKNTINEMKKSREKELNGLISKAIQYIDKNYNKNISLDDVAKELNMSYHYFSKFFKESAGKNFVDYLTELRISKSKEILTDMNISIKEVCYTIGYSDPNYFSKIFKKVTGMTPTEYRINIV